MQTVLECGGHTGPRLELLVPHRAWLTRHHLALQPGLAARAAAVLAPHRRPASPAVIGIHIRRTVNQPTTHFPVSNIELAVQDYRKLLGGRLPHKPEFYHAAVAELRRRWGDLPALVLSDDMAWSAS